MLITRSQKIFYGQKAHAGLLVLLGALLFGATFLEGALQGEFLGFSTTAWLVASALSAIIHQVYVWLCWRLELHGKKLTGLFGRKAFSIYAVFFALLLGARPVLVLGLAISNRGTLPLEQPWGVLIAVVLAVPLVWLVYSVHRYFGLSRAFGIDHFDPAYRFKPLAKEGIFRYTSNGMYIFGFFILWIPGFFFGSIAALAVAAFMHLYIWVHYYCTEKPDMDEIYG